MEQDHLISNSTYDRLKKFVTVVLPAFATLYAGLAQIWSLANSEGVVATCALVATFGGVLLSLSTKSWNNSEAKYDGELIIVENDPDTTIPTLQLIVKRDLNELANKTTVRFKSIDERNAA